MGWDGTVPVFRPFGWGTREDGDVPDPQFGGRRRTSAGRGRDKAGPTARILSEGAGGNAKWPAGAEAVDAGGGTGVEVSKQERGRRRGSGGGRHAMRRGTEQGEGRSRLG